MKKFDSFFKFFFDWKLNFYPFTAEM